MTARGTRPSWQMDSLFSLCQNVGYETPNVCYLSAEESLAALGWDEPAPEYGFETERLLETLGRRSPRPRLFWTHYERCHLPYPFDTPPPARLQALAVESVIARHSIDLRAADRGLLIDAYDTALQRMDKWLERVLAAWDARGPVVITADHAEELLEHGWVGHTSTAEWPTLHHEVLRIPLVLAGFEAVAPGQAIPTDLVARQIDVLPTLCDLLNLPSPAAMDGRSLMDALRGESLPPVTAYAETTLAGFRTPAGDAPHRLRALYSGPHKLIVSSLDETRLYDRSVDVGEQHPLSGADALAETLRQELQSTAAASRAHWRPHPAAAASPAPRLGVSVENDRVVLSLDGDARYEIEYDLPDAIAGTLSANGPSVSLPLLRPARFRARCWPNGTPSAWTSVDAPPHERGH